MGAEPVFFNASFRECLSKSTIDNFFCASNCIANAPRNFIALSALFCDKNCLSRAWRVTHYALFFAVPVALFLGFALVVLLFAFRQRDFGFRQMTFPIQ